MKDLKDLIQAGVHFGHKTSRWSPKMAPFIWGSKNKIHLIDISKTAFLLERAGKFLHGIASEGKGILWVGTKKAASKIVSRIGKDLDMPVVTNRWIGGTLSNYNQIKKAITKLLHLKDVIKKSSSYHTKKELSTLQKEIFRLEKNVGGIVNFNYPPAAIVIVDAKREGASIKEALTMNIPIIAMVDTNTDPTGINFVIPANDDAPKSINKILSILEKHVSEGKEAYKNAKAKELPTKKAVPKKSAKDETLKVVEAKVEVKKVEKKSTAPKIAKKVDPAKKKSEAKTPPKPKPVKTTAKKPVTKRTTTRTSAKKKAPIKKSASSVR